MSSSESKLFVFGLTNILLQILLFSTLGGFSLTPYVNLLSQPAPTPPAGGSCDWWNIACIGATTASAIGYGFQLVWFVLSKVVYFFVLVAVVLSRALTFMFAFNTYITMWNVFVFLTFIYALVHGFL